MIDKFKWLCSQPFIILAAVLAALLFLTAGDDIAFIRETVGGGLLIKTVTAFAAVFVWMACCLIYKLVRVWISDKKDISDAPYYMVFLGLSGISIALIIASIFG